MEIEFKGGRCVRLCIVGLWLAVGRQVDCVSVLEQW